MSIQHTYKTNTGHETKNLTPSKAIKAKCLDCSCWNRSEIEKCPVKDCALYPFRLGESVKVKRVMSEAQRVAASERLHKARSAKKRTTNNRDFEKTPQETHKHRVDSQVVEIPLVEKEAQNV